MNKATKLVIITIITSLLLTARVKAQNGHSYPITRDTLNLFPDSISIKGKVIDYESGVNCGVLCGCGSLKIKLLNKSPAYTNQIVYVGVPCMTIDTAKKLSQKTTWVLRKISLTDKRCFWTEVPMNKFDTKGLPFYELVSAEN